MFNFMFMLVCIFAYMLKKTHDGVKNGNMFNFMLMLVCIFAYMLNKTQDTRQCVKWKYVQLYVYACMHIRIYAKKDT